MALPSYSTGTVTVDAGGTTVIGAGTIWTGGNVSEGEAIFIGADSALIIEVVSATQLTITPWPGAAQAGVAYKVYQNSPRRFDDVQIADDLRKQVQALNTEGFYHFVPPGATAPDPSLGDDEQYAFQADTGKLWQKVNGLWVFIGVYKGVNPKGTWNSVTSYAVNDVVSLNGNSYMATTPNTNSSPPNANWMVLGAAGADATVTVSGTTTGAPGSSASVTSGGTPTNRTLAFNIPRGSVVTVGSTSTGAPGSSAAVTNSGTGGDVALDFTIPTGKSYGGTSATSLTIGIGTKTLTTQAGLAYVSGDRVHIGATSDGLNWMEGFVSDYSSTSMTVAVSDVGGTGTFTAWGIGLTGKPGAGDGDMKEAIYDPTAVGADAFDSAYHKFVQPSAGAVARPALLKMRDVISLKDFNPAANGVTNDSAKMQSAIDAVLDVAGTTRSGKLLIPMGDYYLQDTVNLPKIYQDLVVFGDGRGSKIICNPDNTPAFYIGNNGTPAKGAWKLEDIGFTANDSASGHSVKCENANGVRLENVQFHDLAVAIHLKNTYAPRISGCLFQSVGFNAIYSETDCFNLIIDKGTQFLDCNASASGVATIQIQGEAFNFVLRDSDMEGCGDLIYFIGGIASGLIEGNYLENSKQLVYASGAGFNATSIRGNHINNNTAWEVPAGEDFELVGNSIFNQTITFNSAAYDADVGGNTLYSSTIGSPPWRALTLTNSYTAGSIAPAVRKRRNGLIELRGSADSGNAGFGIATLPSKYLPSANKTLLTCQTSGVTTILTVPTSGVMSSSHSSLILDGISFS